MNIPVEDSEVAALTKSMMMKSEIYGYEISTVFTILVLLTFSHTDYHLKEGTIADALHRINQETKSNDHQNRALCCADL